MKKVITLVGIMVAALSIYAQANMERNLSDFQRVTVGDRINLVLIKGAEPHLLLESDDIHYHEINSYVRNGRLHIYLDHARMFDKNDYYQDSYVTAYVTYSELEGLTVKGDGFHICEDELSSKHFKLKAYGDNEIRLASLSASRLVTKAYGDNDIIIESGTIGQQKFKLYGENQINTLNTNSQEGRITIFGESDVRLAAEQNLKYNILGEGDIRFEGSPKVSQGIVLGEKSIYQYTKKN